MKALKASYLPPTVRGVRKVSLSAVVLVLGLTACGGAHTASVQVGVSDSNGQPLSDAQVWVNGSQQKTFTDATGNATLKGLKTGVYQVEAGVDGYFRQHQTVTVESKGDPSPVSITLPFAPPLGTFVWQPKSTEWVTLSITSYNPFNAQLNIYEWGCFGGSWDQHATQQVTLDAQNNQLTYGYGTTIQIVGPDKLNRAWARSVNGSHLPDTNSTVEPPGACNGDVAAWDSGNSP